MGSGNDLSPTDLAAIDAIAAANTATNQALAQLVQVLGRSGGVDPPERSQPDKPRPKRSRRVTKITQGAGGNLTVEYSDGSAKRLHLSRDDAGDLVAEELDPVAEPALSPATDARPTSEAAPEEALWDGIFGSP